MFCHNCGKSLEFETQNFCRKCGAQQTQSKVLEETRTSSLDLSTIRDLLENSKDVVFMATQTDPFFSDVHPFMYVYTMAEEGWDSLPEYLEGVGIEADDAICADCNIAFTDLNNYNLDDGTDVYGQFCWECISSVLAKREIFTISISPNDYQNWSKLTPRPSAVAWIDDHWRAIDHISDGGNVEVECWGCGYSGTKVNTRLPHWEMTMYPASENPILKAICDTCVNSPHTRILITRV